MYINKYHGSYNIQKRTSSIKYIVVHYTDSGTPNAGSAKANCQYFSRANRDASANYFIDNGGIWEYADPSYYATWHCGDGHGAYGITNANSIGIEVCLSGDKPFTSAEIGYLTELVKYLMNKFSVSVNNVVRHYDASRKQCPLYYAKRNDAWLKLRSQITSSKNGWIKELDNWYYYENGTMVKNVWKKDSKGWCYLGSDGKMAINNWAKDSKGWCYLGSDGYMVTSEWIKYKDKWYYLKKDGYMASSEWIKYKNEWYYLKEDGIMASNEWIKYKDKWYYLKSSGVMASSEWIKYKNEWYYLKEDGIMETETVTINGKVYNFDKSGKWLG